MYLFVRNRVCSRFLAVQKSDWRSERTSPQPTLASFRFRPLKILLWAVAIGAAGLFLFWPVMWLELELTDGDGMRRMERVVTKVGEPFSVQFIHSVELRPVVEYFTIDERGEIVLTGTRFQGFGAGLPTDGGDGTFFQQGDAFVITGLHRPVGELRVRLHPMNEYTVSHRRRTYKWPNASAGARLTLRGMRAGRLVGWLTGLVERRN